MSVLDPAAVFAGLAERASADPVLAREGRWCTAEILVEIGEEAWHLVVERGRVAEVVRGPLRMRPWTFAVRAPRESWERFWSARPEPGYQDLFAMARHGHARIEGDLGPLLANLRYVKRLLALPRAPAPAAAEAAPVPGAGPAAGTVEPITGRYVHLDVDGERYRVYFEEAGSGIPLLCLHTAGAHSSQYRHLMTDPAVTDRFRVLAFDLPWHGKSDPPAGWQDREYRLTTRFYEAIVMAFVEALSLERPVVMGCSMGGRLVVRLAAAHGARLGGVIGLEGSDHPEPWYDGSWLERPEFRRGDFCAALVSGLLAPQSPGERRWETLWHYHQSGPDVFRGDMHFYRTDSEYRAEVSAIDAARCPVILMTGEYDYSCTPEATRASAARIPGAEAIVMEGLGHFPMSENPARFREHLLPVLERLREERGP